jgi:aminomuconate-semialdehyde/2-hydroxymuconate-6-semialdehyde dehydrogenase
MASKKKSKLFSNRFKMMKLNNFIDGQFVEPIDNKYIDIFCPATGEKSGDLPDSQAADVENAVEAARNAFPLWSSLPPIERSKVCVLFVCCHFL